MKFKNYLLALICIICCIFAASYTASAKIASGSCGSSATWSLDEDGVLTISGSGDMTDYTTASKVAWYSYRDDITKVIVKEGITSVGKYSFRSCEELADVSLPQSLEDIGPHAFRECISLKNIQIPDNVTLIGERAFDGCEALLSVELGDKLTSIGSEAFADCAMLTQIKIPKSVEEIGDEILPTYTEIVVTVYYDSVAMQYCMDCEYNYNVICTMSFYSDSALFKYDEYGYGDSIVLPKNTITKEGYDFTGWEINSVSHNDGDTIVINNNLIANAVWELQTFDIIFETGGGTNPQPVLKKYGESITLPDAEKEGYNLLGWALKYGSATVEYKVGDTFSLNADAVLYGVWKMKTYTVKFDANGGSANIPNHTKHYWEKLQIPDTIPTRSGYTFVGWGIDSEAVVARYQPGALLEDNADITLYAVWKTGITAGDSDNNGRVDISDLLFMMKRIRNYNFNITDDNKTAMDVFKDTYFNIKDVLKMSQHLAGWSNVILGE